MKYTIILMFVVPLLALKCKKEDEGPEPTPVENVDTTDYLAQEIAKLPPITTTGEDVFAAIVNGKAYVTGACCYGSNVQEKSASYYQGQTNIGGGLYEDGATSNTYYISLSAYNVVTGKIQIGCDGEYKYCGAHIISRAVDSVSCRYYTREWRDEYVHYEGEWELLRRDTINKVMSGTFAFEAYFTSENRCGDTIRVTHGRFDIPF